MPVPLSRLAAECSSFGDMLDIERRSRNIDHPQFQRLFDEYCESRDLAGWRKSLYHWTTSRKRPSYAALMALADWLEWDAEAVTLATRRLGPSLPKQTAAVTP